MSRPLRQARSWRTLQPSFTVLSVSMRITVPFFVYARHFDDEQRSSVFWRIS